MAHSPMAGPPIGIGRAQLTLEGNHDATPRCVRIMNIKRLKLSLAFSFVALSLIAGLAVLGTRPQIEADLKSRVEASLAEAGLSWLDVTITGRDVRLEGAVFSSDEKSRAEAIAAEVWGIDNVSSRLQVAVRDTPYRMTILLQPDRLRLRGAVPSEEAERTILGLANANFPGLEISTRLQIDPNMAAMDTWMSGIGFALTQLKQMTSGQAVLSESDLSFEGNIARLGGYESVRRAFREETPAAITVTQFDIKPPAVEPFTWQIALEDDAVIFNGHAPSEVAQASMTFFAERILPGLRVIDNTVIASGYPSAWWNAARRAVHAISYLRSGTVTITGKQVEINGISKTQASFAQLAELEKQWPEGFSFSQSVREADTQDSVPRSSPARARLGPAEPASINR
jgi:hypothetical protein